MENTVRRPIHQCPTCNATFAMGVELAEHERVAKHGIFDANNNGTDIPADIWATADELASMCGDSDQAYYDRREDIAAALTAERRRHNDQTFNAMEIARLNAKLNTVTAERDSQQRLAIRFQALEPLLRKARDEIDYSADTAERHGLVLDIDMALNAATNRTS